MPLTISANSGIGARTVGMVTADREGKLTIRAVNAEGAETIRRQIETGVEVETRAPRAPRGDRHAKGSE